MPNDLRSLITEACSLPHCPDLVRIRIAEYLSTGKFPATVIRDAAHLDNAWWDFLNAAACASMSIHRGGSYALNYDYYRERARFHLCKLRRLFPPVPSHDDDPR